MSILEEYHFSNYMKNVDIQTDEVAFRLLDFVCDNFGHNGNIGLPEERKIEDLIQFCKAHDGKMNCRGLSILLASLLRLYSVKARHITCMPYEHSYADCHVVVDCLLPSGKRVMLDPTYRLFLKNEQGKYVSIDDLRNLLIADAPIYFNENASYNGSAGIDEEFYRHYMIKNAFRFARSVLYNFEGEDRTADIELIPANYHVEEYDEAQRGHLVYDDIAFWNM